MTDSQSPIGFPALQFFTNGGLPLAGGTVSTFAADGTTPKLTYSDPAGANPNGFSVPLDSAGRCALWGTGDYVFSVYDSTSALLYTLPIATGNASLAVSAAMLPVIQALTVAQALSLLGGQPAGPALVIPPGLGPLPWAGPNAAPTAWLFCDGSLVSRTTYALLFAAIGTIYGAGDGVTNFALPDMRGRAVFGRDDMGSGGAAGRLTSAGSGVNATIVGAAGGDQLMPTHTHGVTDPGHQHSFTAATVDFTNHGFAGGGLVENSTMTTASASTGMTINNAGAGASANVPPALVCQYIIYAGV